MSLFLFLCFTCKNRFVLSLYVHVYRILLAAHFTSLTPQWQSYAVGYKCTNFRKRLTETKIGNKRNRHGFA